MKYILTLLSLCLGVIVYGTPGTYTKLVEVNHCWSEQPAAGLPAYKATSEKEWIRLHLQLVEQRLRGKSLQGLSAKQQQLRTQALNDLHQYWQAGNFPLNERYSYRTPIFIDEHNNFCAVGYLIKASGREDLSRQIARRNNLAYVREMHYPELDQWAVQHGFTEDELAWIQPGYPPQEEAAGVGDGVDGEVHELYADDAHGKLYVGGSFVQVDGTITANNIAYVTEQNNEYTWHSMAGGVNGPVYAMAAFDGKVFVAGHFTQAGTEAANNIAYWDGAAWHAVGCTYGTIYDLIVYKNELYASGSFDVCAAMSDVNVAKWNGSGWQQIPGLSGRVNTMEVVNNDLLLGGAFTFGDETESRNAIRWNQQNNFQPFEGDISNEVMDFEWYKGVLHAACKQTSPSQLSSSLYQLTGNAWVAPEFTFYGFSSLTGAVSFNTLCVEGEDLMIGGNFNYSPGMGTYANNFITISGTATNNGNWFLVDSAINKMVHFKGLLFAGGKFKTGSPMGGGVVLNGMARRSGTTTGISKIRNDYKLSIYPNPVNERRITIESDLDADMFLITDISGRSVATGALQSNAVKQDISLPEMAPGMYLLNISNKNGERVMKKITVQ